jgi:hypothetical protein
MIIGVISFSFATGSLSSILSNYDSKEAFVKEKMATLNEIEKEYGIPHTLYDSLRLSIKYDHGKNYNDFKQFMDELPYKLKIELSYLIHSKLYMEVEFFNEKDKSFIAWVGPLLKPTFCSELEYIFMEGDKIRDSKLLFNNFDNI